MSQDTTQGTQGTTFGFAKVAPLSEPGIAQAAVTLHAQGLPITVDAIADHVGVVVSGAVKARVTQVARKAAAHDANHPLAALAAGASPQGNGAEDPLTMTVRDEDVLADEVARYADERANAETPALRARATMRYQRAAWEYRVARLEAELRQGIANGKGKGIANGKGKGNDA